MMMEENMVTAMQEQVEDRVVQETDRPAGSEDDDGGEHGDSHAGAGGGQGGAGDRQARLEDWDGGGTGDGADIAGRDLSETLCGKDAGETQHGVWGHDGQVEH